MGSDEFECGAAAIIDQVAALPPADRYAAAARGSANPAGLVWLAEGLQLSPDSVVVDLGAGMGGPAAWLQDHYRSHVVAIEPASTPARAARTLFELSSIRASASAVPLRSGACDAALLLGVTSVVADPLAVLREAFRVAPRLGLLDWCAQGPSPLHAGGSTFPTPTQLLATTGAAGWILAQTSALQLDAPYHWHDVADTIETPADDDEQAVIAAIDSGELAPFMLLAHR